MHRTKLIRMADWEEVSQQFTLKEKANLNKAYAGETLCPRAIVVNLDKLDTALIKKLDSLLSKE